MFGLLLDIWAYFGSNGLVICDYICHLPLSVVYSYPFSRIACTLHRDNAIKSIVHTWNVLLIKIEGYKNMFGLSPFPFVTVAIRRFVVCHCRHRRNCRWCHQTKSNDKNCVTFGNEERNNENETHLLACIGIECMSRWCVVGKAERPREGEKSVGMMLGPK